MDCAEFVQVGMRNEARGMSSRESSAAAVGSGSLEVFATPAMIALMEQAASQLADQLLPEGWTSVGVKLDIAHTAATPCGMEVRAAAEVTAVSGSRISFGLTAWDEMGKIGSGTHERVAVRGEDFQKKAEGKLSAGRL